MNIFETSATVEEQGRVHLAGVPFAAGTEVEITISPKVQTDNELKSPEDEKLAAARERMREQFLTIKGFRMVPKLSREELYDGRCLR